MDSITVRRMPFEFDEDVDPVIVPADPEQSFAMVAGSLLLPHLEPYLIRSMKAAEQEIDDPALLAAFDSPAFYIGCLGSKKTHTARLKRLRDAGVSDNHIARIHAPVGLDIGAQNPSEIAVATLAQITQALRRPV